jgi:hypothetical protein
MIDTHHLDQTDQLSPQGQARSEAMLHELVGFMHTNRRRRTERKTLIAGVLFIALTSAIALTALTTVNTLNMPRPLLPNDRSSVLSHASNQFEIVPTSPGIADRYRANVIARVERLDDRSLLNVLAQLNRPTGLIRSEGRTWLTQDVTDAIDKGS